MTGRYRWWIGALLVASTVINYLDRQTLSVLAPYLKTEFSWSNETFAFIVIAFRLSYTVMQAVGGRLLDRFGTRDGLTLSVLWYSTAAMLTSLASGFRSFCGFRFLLGAGEAGNWPGATKAVSEWFPARERGWAVALFDSGSSFGAAIAVVLVPFLYRHGGGWRPAFLITGALGFLWVIAWRMSYHPPESHPRLGAAEREMILADRKSADPGADPAAEKGTVPAPVLLRLPQTWGAIASRGLTDPVWFMITDWFAIYLVSKGYDLEKTALGFWVPFLAADLGNFFGGGASSALIRRGWSVGRARRTLIVAGGFGVLALVPAAFT
jgi:ACS family hexuronate transporter-like MFS transporter